MVKKSLRQFTLMATATVTLLLGVCNRSFTCSASQLNGTILIL